MTLQLSPQLEYALVTEATRRGMSPDDLASELIRAQLPNDIALENSQICDPKLGTTSHDKILDKWESHFASLPPPSDEPRPEWLRADNVSEAFGKILEERKRQGHL